MEPVLSMESANSDLSRPLRRRTVLPCVTNPFENAVPWTKYEIFKAALLCWWLLPLRILLLITSFIVHHLFCRMAACGVKMTNDRGTFYVSEPFPLWRRILLYPCALTNRLIVLALGYWPFCIRIVDERKDKSFNPNTIVIAPHMTFLDPFIVAVAFPPLPSGVGKLDLLSTPLLGAVGRASQGIFVDRKNPDSRHSCKEAIATRSRASWTGPPMIIFPEGTTTNGKVLIQFKMGAFSPGEAVQPVVLRFPNRFYNPAWCGKNSSQGMAMVRCMLQFANFCEVTLQDPYVPSPVEKKDAILFANNVRAQMATELGVGTTEHSYDDLFFSLNAEKANINQDFEVSALKQAYDINLDQLKGMLKQFQALDKDRSGSLSHDEFANALRATGSGPFSDDASIDRLFTFFDTEGNGQISYREFVQGASICSAKCSNESRAKLAFLVFDVEGTGRVQTSSLQKALDSPLEHNSQKNSDPFTLGSRIEKAAGGKKELDFKSFCKLVEQEPAVVDQAMDIVRSRFGFGEPDSSHI